MDQRGRARRLERELRAEHLVEHDAERPHVHAGGRRLSLELLGRHVRERADDALALGDLRAEALVHRGREAEVQEPHRDRASVADADVPGLDVAVHDARRVHVGERLRDADGQLQRVLPAERSILADHLVERAAFDELHHVEGAELGLDAEVGHLRHPRGAHARERLRLAAKAGLERLVPAIGPDQLQREALLELEVLDLDHLAHAPGADLADHTVALGQHVSLARPLPEEAPVFRVLGQLRHREGRKVADRAIPHPRRTAGTVPERASLTLQRVLR